MNATVTDHPATPDFAAIKARQRATWASGDFAVIGPDITDVAGELPATAGCGPDERIVRLPRRILVDARRDIPQR